LHVPDGDGPWPGVLVFPDIYYRAGEWVPFDVATLFTEPGERARMGTLVQPLSNDRIIADATAYAEFLLARPEVSGTAIGTTGYCLGGYMSLVAATGLGRTVAAVSDNPTYDEAAQARHWDALARLYQAELAGG